MASLDEKYNANELDVKVKNRKICLEQESKGKGSMYFQMQPFSWPDVEDLVGRLIDVLCSVE